MATAKILMMRWAVLLALALAAPRSARCNIPVFRYALERWQAACYEVIVFHRGALGGAARDAVEELRGKSANIMVDHVDLATATSPRFRELWDARKGATEPWMVALYPGRDLIAWAGPASAESVRALVESPARRETARRILSGETAVWVLLESGDPKADDAAARLIDGELRKLEKSVKPPVHREDDPPLLSEIPVKILFSTLRVSRTNPAERPFVEMLLGGDTETKGPIVFPIFGRGRALGALTGETLSTEMVGNAGFFMTGPCACEVKEDNPGIDLLLAVDWEQALTIGRAEEPKPIPIPEIAKGSPPEPPNPPKPPEAPPSSPAPSRLLLWLGLGIAAVLVLTTGRRAFRRA